MNYPLIRCTVFTIVVLFLISCKKVDKENYRLGSDGIFIEEFDSENTNPDKYSLDNQIYKNGRVFTYSYYYQDLKGQKFLFTLNPKKSYKASGWGFTPIENPDEHSITKIQLIPKPNKVSESFQTLVSYNYFSSSKLLTSEETGVIENEKNVWMHPPRLMLFKILELNPFPFIMGPYKVGTKWTWSLNIPEHWSDERWKIWKGPIKNQYHYEIIDKKYAITKLGKIEYLIIKGIATSKIGKTELISYFNEELGFVKLDYTNVDGTKTFLELEDVSWNLTKFGSQY